MKTNEDKFNLLKNDFELFRQSCRDTDKHINACLPILTFNLMTETLHSCLEGSQFNKLVRFEKVKYLELENQVNLKRNEELSKLKYEIPPIPEEVEEVQY